MARLVGAVPRVLAGLLIGLITVLLMASVIGRYTGLYALVWAEEAARAMFLWMTMLGAAAAVERGGHFRLDVLEKLLPANGRRLLVAFVQLTLGLLGLALLVSGTELVGNSGGQFTNALGIPLGAINIAVPAGGLFFVWFAVRNVRAVLSDRTGS